MARCAFGINADIFHIPVVFGIIHPISDDELIGYLKPDIIRLDRHQPPLRLVEAGGNFE